MRTNERARVALVDDEDGVKLSCRVGDAEMLPVFTAVEIEMVPGKGWQGHMTIDSYASEAEIDIEAICQDDWLVEPRRVRITKPYGDTLNGAIAVRDVETGRLFAFMGLKLKASAERKSVGLLPLVELDVVVGHDRPMADDFEQVAFAKPGMRVFFLPDSIAKGIAERAAVAA